jgi:YbbR domain-containing protein
VKTNTFWFVASFVMAFLVWIVATTQANPIGERTFTAIPIVAEPDDGRMVVEQPTRNARVQVRAQESVLNVLQNEDIIVRARLDGLGPGTHTVELDVNIARRANADPQPKQITVTLEQIQSQQVQVIANIVEAPPPGYERAEPIFSETQTLVSGASSKVSQVVAAQAVIDLTDQRDTVETDARLVPVNVNGEPVADVTLNPPTVGVTVEINRRDDVREVSITPNIDASTLPDNFVLSSISYEPQTVLVIGSPDELSAIPDTLFTELIDLTDRTADFEITVPVVFPDQQLSLLGDQNVTVSIQIIAQTTTRQFEAIPVEIIGLPDNVNAEIIPTEVTALVTGPQTALESLEPSDIRVVIDVNGLAPGTYDLAPQASITQTTIRASNISTFPSAINVTISVLEEATEPPAP